MVIFIPLDSPIWVLIGVMGKVKVKGVKQVVYSLVKWSRTPDTWSNEIKIAEPNKTLILSQNAFHKYDVNTGFWVNVGLPQTEEEKELLFQEYGMEDVSYLSSEIISELGESNVKILTYVPN